jgi:methylated-DNA-[protein]-cysteine S-methyltransferase
MTMAKLDQGDLVHAFRTPLGWFAILGRDATLKALAFGYASADEAARALDPDSASGARRGRWNGPLVLRLQAYARGRPDNFSDIAVDLGGQTEFQRRVIRACRKIAWGTTTTYGQLAAAAGYPGAARAVGSCMAANRIPLVVPCHRVLGADRRLHGYSGPGGLKTKLRLLELERAV